MSIPMAIVSMVTITRFSFSISLAIMMSIVSMTVVSWLSFSRSFAIMMSIISMAIVSMTIPMSMVIVGMIGISCCFSFRLSITQDCCTQAQGEKNNYLHCWILASWRT